MNQENKTNPQNDTPKFYTKQRQSKRDQLKRATDPTQKQRLRQEILQSQIDQKKQELEKKQKERQSLNHSIKETYYQKIDELKSFYRDDLKIITSGKGLNRRFGKSASYFQSSKINGNNPTVSILDDIIIDLEVINEHIDIFIDKSSNQKDIKSTCHFLLSFFQNLKNRVLFG